MQPNGESKYGPGSSEYVEEVHSLAGAKHGLSGSQQNNATMASQVRVSSKDGARKKKS